MREDKTNPWFVFVALSIMAILTDMDLTIVNLSISTIAKATQAMSSQMQLFFSVYNITAAIVMILGGILADHILGKKKVYVIGLTCFLLGSFLSGTLTQNIYYLIAGRALQGIGFGLTISLGAVILSQIFPKEKQGTAIGMYMMSMAIAQAVGPLVGGIIVQYWDWPWIFLINVVPVLISLLLLLKYYQPDPIKESSRTVLSVGFLLFGFTVLLVMIFLSEISQNNHFSLIILASLALLSGILFIKNERNSSCPIFEKSLLSNTYFLNMLLIRSINMFIFGTILYFIPLYLQKIVHFSPLHTGMILATMTAAMVVISPLTGILCDRSWTHHLSILSFVLMMPAMIMLAITTHYSHAYFMICLAFSGISVGILATTSVVTVAQVVPEHISAKAMGILYTTLLIAFALGGTCVSIFSNKIVSLKLASLLRDQGSQLLDFDFVSDTIQISGSVGSHLLEQFKFASIHFGFHFTFWFCFLLNLVALFAMGSFYKKQKCKIFR